MACDCLKRIRELLRQKTNESAEVNSAFMEDGTIRVVITGYYHKKNSKGEYQQKWSEANLLAEYCPFCGKPYKEK